jgi:hypothetical protein
LNDEVHEQDEVEEKKEEDEQKEKKKWWWCTICYDISSRFDGLFF